MCTYSCVYCQLGPTGQLQVERQAFYEPKDILAEVEVRLEQARRAGEPIDYLTFISDGEPTLDIHLGQEIELLKPLGIKIAVVSNASLIWRADVRCDLMAADWVSLKVDSIRRDVWHKVNRPHGALDLDSVFDGMLEFASEYGGKLATETMLTSDINDHDYYLTEVADFLSRFKPDKPYITIPIRPPAEEWVHPDQSAFALAKRMLTASSLMGWTAVILNRSSSAFPVKAKSLPS